MADEINAMLKRKKAVIPEKGFRVVGVDSFAQPGDASALYVCGDFDTREAAEKALEKEKKEQPSDKFYIYDSKTN